MAAAICVALTVSGCATYVPRIGPPGAVLAGERARVVLVSLRDGRTVEVLEPALRVDSTTAAADTVLAGYVFDARLGRRARIALPLRDIVGVTARVADHGASATLVTILIMAPVTVVLLFYTICSTNRRGCFD